LAVFFTRAWRPAYEATSRIDKAQQAAVAGRFDEAHALLDAAFEADPLYPAPLSLNGRLYLRRYERSRTKQAELLEFAAQCYQKAIEVNPVDYKNYEKLGWVYGLMGRNAEAYDMYLESVARYDGCGRIWFLAAQAADRLVDTDSALAGYRRAVEIENAYREQFRQMYPERDEVVSRIGQEYYQTAMQRIRELSR
jgi:tetratricopeptide (TPR) repeat protein